MTFSFLKKHFYISIGVGLLLLVALVIAPWMLIADSRDSGPSCPSYDRDCDGIPNTTGACRGNTCVAPDSDDNDADKGTWEDEGCGGFC